MIDVNVFLDCQRISYVRDVLEAMGDDMPRLLGVSLGEVAEYLSFCWARFGDDPFPESPTDAGALPERERWSLASDKAASLRHSLCLSDDYRDVPLDVQLHVTVLSNSLSRMARHRKGASHQVAIVVGKEEEAIG